MILEPNCTFVMSGANATGGWSETAGYVDEQTRQSRTLIERTHTFGAGIDQLRQELCTVFDECSAPNWDGYGAASVAAETYRNAYRLVEALPLGIPLPTVSAEPDGHLALEWHRNPRRTLSVSISPEGDLHFAALIGREKDYGTRAFTGEVPGRVFELIQQVCAG